MSEHSEPEINLEELMVKVRAEVKRRQASKGLTRERQGIAYPSRVRSRGAESSRRADGPITAASRFQIKEAGYTVHDFLQYHDAEFLKCAYRGILGRTPDPSGYETYLSALRTACMTRVEVLGRLRYSTEGRDRNVRVRGLLPRLLIDSSFRVPVLGYVGRLVSGILRLPALIRNLQQLDNTLHGQLSAIRLDMDASRAKMAQLADLEELDVRKADHVELEAMITQKADVSLLEELQSASSKLDHELQNHHVILLDQYRHLGLLPEEAHRRFARPLVAQEIRDLLRVEEHLWDADYAEFEDRFRGPREDVQERVRCYLPMVREALASMNDAAVLDVGCGRGEWLELLKAEGLLARGVDSNRTMVGRCQKLGLDVVEADALHHLRSLPANSLGAISGIHVIEHLAFRTLVKLLDESLRVLKPGGVIIFETPNPENITVGACDFYLDPSHNRPLHPVAMHWLVEQRGYTGVKIVRSKDNQLAPYSGKKELSDLLELFNASYDFAVIGYKQGESG
jgi:SAM-dependent methyltransferase